MNSLFKTQASRLPGRSKSLIRALKVAPTKPQYQENYAAKDLNAKDQKRTHNQNLAHNKTLKHIVHKKKGLDTKFSEANTLNKSQNIGQELPPIPTAFCKKSKSKKRIKFKASEIDESLFGKKLTFLPHINLEENKKVEWLKTPVWIVQDEFIQERSFEIPRDRSLIHFKKFYNPLSGRSPTKPREKENSIVYKQWHEIRYKKKIPVLNNRVRAPIPFSNAQDHQVKDENINREDLEDLGLKQLQKALLREEFENSRQDSQEGYVIPRSANTKVWETREYLNRKMIKEAYHDERATVTPKNRTRSDSPLNLDNISNKKNTIDHILEIIMKQKNETRDPIVNDKEVRDVLKAIKEPYKHYEKEETNSFYKTRYQGLNGDDMKFWGFSNKMEFSHEKDERSWRKTPPIKKDNAKHSFDHSFHFDKNEKQIDKSFTGDKDFRRGRGLKSLKEGPIIEEKTQNDDSHGLIKKEEKIRMEIKDLIKAYGEGKVRQQNKNKYNNWKQISLILQNDPN